MLVAVGVVPDRESSTLTNDRFLQTSSSIHGWRHGDVGFFKSSQGDALGRRSAFPRKGTNLLSAFTGTTSTETKINSSKRESYRKRIKPLDRLHTFSLHARKSLERPQRLEEPKPAKSKRRSTARLSALCELPKHVQLRKEMLLALRKHKNLQDKHSIDVSGFSEEDPMMEIYDVYGGPPFADYGESGAYESSLSKSLASVISKNSVYKSMVESTFSTECENYMLDDEERMTQYYHYKLFTQTLQP